MNPLRRTTKTREVMAALRTCISPRCNNVTQTFYCDECWDDQQPSTTSA